MLAIRDWLGATAIVDPVSSLDMAGSVESVPALGLGCVGDGFGCSSLVETGERTGDMEGDGLAAAAGEDSGAVSGEGFWEGSCLGEGRDDSDGAVVSAVVGAVVGAVIGAVVGAVVGAVIGAAIGAAIGAGIGAVVGAVVGAVIGAVVEGGCGLVAICAGWLPRGVVVTSVIITPVRRAIVATTIPASAPSERRRFQAMGSLARSPRNPPCPRLRSHACNAGKRGGAASAIVCSSSSGEPSRSINHCKG